MFFQTSVTFSSISCLHCLSCCLTLRGKNWGKYNLYHTLGDFPNCTEYKCICTVHSVISWWDCSWRTENRHLTHKTLCSQTVWRSFLFLGKSVILSQPPKHVLFLLLSLSGNNPWEINKSSQLKLKKKFKINHLWQLINKGNCKKNLYRIPVLC